MLAVFNKKNKTHITAWDVFEMLDFITWKDEAVGLECKYILCRAEQERLGVKEYLAVKFGFDAKAPMLSKTILFGKCWEMLGLPDSCTKWLWEAI